MAVPDGKQAKQAAQPGEARKRGNLRNLAREEEVVRLREQGVTLEETGRRVGRSATPAGEAPVILPMAQRTDRHARPPGQLGAGQAGLAAQRPQVPAEAHGSPASFGTPSRSRGHGARHRGPSFLGSPGLACRDLPAQIAHLCQAGASG
jgi:hypothetical protein